MRSVLKLDERSIFRSDPNFELTSKSHQKIFGGTIKNTKEFKAHFNSEWDLGELICKTLMRNGVSEEILFKVVDALPADRKTVADGFESTIFERS